MSLGSQPESRKAPSSAWRISVCRSAAAAAEAAGAINPVVEEANKKIMSFCAFEHDPLFEDEMLKGVGTGVYQQVFDTMDYDNAPSEELVDLLLDGLESVGYIV